MAHTLKVLLTGIVIFIAKISFGQDSTASINISWQYLCSDTTQTYAQMVTTCDSLFFLAGYPVYADTASQSDTLQAVSSGNDTSSAADTAGPDSSPFLDYLKWKAFWVTRLDEATGKPHNFASDPYDTTSAQQRTSALPCYLLTGIPPAASSFFPPGWSYIGPQNVAPGGGTNPADPSTNNAINCRLGKIIQIIVNPANHDEVYVAAAWGGLWKTTNASAAPNNTCTNITDHDWMCPGLGVSSFDVDFSVTPHKLFWIAGYPDKQAYLYSPQRTDGLFFSPDDGLTFQHLDISSAFYGEDYNEVKFYPGYTIYDKKFLFLTTAFKVVRVDITGPWHGTSSTLAVAILKDMLPYLTPGVASAQFRGFTDMAFHITTFNQQLFFAANSSVGNTYPSSARLYRQEGCNGDFPATPYAPYAPVDLTPSLGPPGGSNCVSNSNFAGLTGWYAGAGWGPGAAGTAPIVPPDAEIPPAVVSSLETDVIGSAEPQTYSITFNLSLPSNTEVDVVLNNAAPYATDWGLAATAGTIIPVGHYANTTGGTVTASYAASITSTHYVNRLEFGAYSTGAFPFGSKIILGNVVVKVPYQDYVYNLTSSQNPSASDDLYCLSSIGTSIANRLQISTISPGTAITLTQQPMQGSIIAPSATDPDIVYTGSDQSGWGPMLYSVNMATGAITWDASSVANHPDLRCMAVVANGTTDGIYIGNDGGIAYGKFGGPWTNYNGKGLSTSLPFSIGSSIHTGEVGLATADNGVLTTNTWDYTNWNHAHGADGAEVKYGKRRATINERFYGVSSGSSFTSLCGAYLGGSSVITGLPTAYPGYIVNSPPLAKVVTTIYNEYFGTGGGNIYDVNATVASPTSYTGNYHCITCGTGFVHSAVQAVAPDPYDPTCVAAYVHTSFWDPGSFQLCVNATSAAPTWTSHLNTTWEYFISLAIDPRSPSTAKRLWAGAGWYRPGGDHRVFVSTDGGTTFADYSTGLPNGPVNALAYDEQSHVLFAGTDQGVYSRDIDDPTCGWMPFTLGMPAAFVVALDINRCTGKIYAACYGRGGYEAELPPASNWNGTDASSGGLNDNSCIINIQGTHTAPAFWTNDTDITRTIYIGPGKSLVIQNCTVNMGRNKNIFVDVGGSLIVEGATITNTCGTMWGTISVLGNPSASPQDLSHTGDPVNAGSAPYCVNQGFLLLQKYTGTPNRDPVLENSYGAIIVGNQYYDGTDIYDYVAGKEGGLLFANHTTFHNCASGIFFKQYSPHVNTSYVSDCHFLADAPLQSPHFVDHTTSTPRPFGMEVGVDISGNWGISFWNDTFETRNNAAIGFNPDYDLRGVGYNGYSAYTSFNGCQFLNMTRGILDATTFAGMGFNTQVFNCTFTNNWHALSNGGCNNFVCYSSQFTTGHRPAIYPAGVTADASCGIWSLGWGFHIRENTISSGGFGGDIGIVLTGDASNALYGNTINGCWFGLLSTHTILPGTAGYGGYQIQCNTLNYNRYGIYDESLISPAQGSLSSPVQNRFYNDIIQFDNTSPSVFNYYSSSNIPYKLVPGRYIRVNPVSTTDCPNFGTDCCPVLSATMFHIGTGGNILVSDATAGLSATEQQIVGPQSYLVTGNAPGLYAAISNQSLSSAAVASVLIQAGPYLSDGVLLAAIDRSPALDYSDLKSVIINNSALNIPVLNELAAVDSILNADTAVINAQNNQSSRQQVESSLLNLNSLRNEYITALSFYYDSVSDWVSGAQLFASRSQYEQAFPYYLNDSDWNDAQNMIDSIPDTLLTSLMAIHLQHIQQGVSIDSLSSSDSTTIVTMSADRSTHSGEVAYNWYTHAYSLPYFEYLDIDSSLFDSSSQRTLLNSSKNNRNNVNNQRVVSYFPNPATSMVSANIDNGPWGAGATITASDIYGQKIMTIQPPANASRANINTQLWKSGIYIFTVQLSNGIIYTSKVVIARE